jgi:hypothetical protein
MTLRTRWRDLERSTVGAAPERYGYYELGDDDGNVIGRDWGVLRDELKEALAYGDGSKVRWETAQSREHAKDLFEDHGE